MYKVIWLAKFRPDLPREDVLTWWRGHHAELAKAAPGMLRYVQSYWVEALDPNNATADRSRSRSTTAMPSIGSRASRRTRRAWPARNGRLTLEDGPNGFSLCVVRRCTRRNRHQLGSDGRRPDIAMTTGVVDGRSALDEIVARGG